MLEIDLIKCKKDIHFCLWSFMATKLTLVKQIIEDEVFDITNGIIIVWNTFFPTGTLQLMIPGKSFMSYEFLFRRKSVLLLFHGEQQKSKERIKTTKNIKLSADIFFVQFCECWLAIFLQWESKRKHLSDMRKNNNNNDKKKTYNVRAVPVVTCRTEIS